MKISNDPKEPGHGRGGRMPRWVAVTGIVIGVLVVLAVAVLVISGGEHGPGRHLSSGVDAHAAVSIRIAGEPGGENG